MSVAKKVWIGGFALAVLVTAALLSTTDSKKPLDQSATDTKAAQKEERAAAGYLAPQFELKTLDGNKTVKLSDLKGKPIIVNFWASWCGPCKQEMPDLEATHQQYKDKVQFYGINITTLDKEDQVRAAVQAYGVTYPILMDRDETVSRRYLAASIPMTYAIDSNGMVLEKRVGALSKLEMDGMVQRLVASAASK